MIEKKQVGHRRYFTSLLGVGLAALVGGACGGETGPAGPAGGRGGDGVPGADGADGAEGTDGKDATLDPTLSPLEKAFAAIGGKAILLDLASFRIDATGTRRILGEQFAPEDHAAPGSAFQRTVSADLANDWLRNDVDRTVTWENIGAPQAFTELVRGDLGHIVGVDNLFGFPQGDLLSDGTAAIRREHRLVNPHLILRDVAADPSLATDAGLAVVDGVAFHLVAVGDPIHPLTLHVSVNTGRIARLSTLETDPLLRDVEVEVHYVDWMGATGGIQFPQRVALTVDGEVLFEETRGSIEANVALDPVDFDFPPGASPAFVEAEAQRGAANAHYHQEFAGVGLRPAFDGLQTTVVATELTPGVFHLTGGTHHSMAVEQDGGIVLVEGPLYGARSQALLAWASTQFPGKPVSHVVATHFHIDHSGGLRELVAAGATLVADASSEQLYRRVLSAPSKLAPDALEASPTDAALTLVSGSGFALPDPIHPIQVRRLVTGHAEDMLVIELPADQILFESDFFNPGALNFEDEQKLLRDDMIANGLTGYTIVGGHGTGPVTFADLQAAIAAP